jgi:hypothetical protein
MDGAPKSLVGYHDFVATLTCDFSDDNAYLFIYIVMYADVIMVAKQVSLVPF